MILAVNRFGKALDVQFDIGGNARLDLMDAGNILESSPSGFPAPASSSQTHRQNDNPDKPGFG